MGEHDRLFRRAFRLPQHAAGLFASILPAELLAVIDLGTLELVEGNLIDGRLRERFADALFQARFRVGEDYVTGFIHLLLEHQSEPDEWMPYRALEHMVRTWGEARRREPSLRRLPPAVCVIVHHGESGWTVPRRMHELVEGLAEAPVLRRYVPDFELIIDEVGELSDAALAARPMEPFAKLVVWALRDSRTIGRLLEHVEFWAGELERLSRVSPEDATTLLRYILSVAGERSYEDLRQRFIDVAPATEAAMGSAAEQLIQQGEATGELRGKTLGKAEGKAEDVLAILEARRLTCSSEQSRRVLACTNLATLDQWLRLAVTCDDASALFS